MGGVLGESWAVLIEHWLAGCWFDKLSFNGDAYIFVGDAWERIFMVLGGFVNTKWNHDKPL